MNELFSIAGKLLLLPEQVVYWAEILPNTLYSREQK